jgi:predicted TIM-barrel fold metal-dependent hydrolase
VLADACGIETALTQGLPLDAAPDPLLTRVDWSPGSRIFTRKIVSENYGRWAPAPIRTLEDLEAAADAFVDKSAAAGAVGVKLYVMPFTAPDRDAARAVFDRLMADPEAVAPEVNPLTELILDRMVARCGERGLVVCLHTGYWGDFRTLDPSGALPLVSRHRGVRFDLYHVGYPYVREAIMLGKAQPNVWLNLCWTYIISQKFAGDALEEMLEMVPLNKILGFGGDYRVVEKVYGHLVMARETIARTLAKMVSEKRMTLGRAAEIARMMLRDNPKDLYRLKIE